MKSMNDLTFYDVPDKWGNTWKITFIKEHYMDGNLAIQMVNLDPDEGYPEEYGDLTVNVEFLADPYRACIDVNNMGDILVEWLVNQSIAIDTGRKMHSGFCNYPVVEFSREWVDALPSFSEVNWG